MIRRAKTAVRVLLAAALLYGSGAHWLLVQGGAWAAMIAERAGSDSLLGALTTTFDGQHPCQVCLLVQRGADADQAPRAISPTMTVDFAIVSAPAVPSAVGLFTPVDDAPASFASALRVPPSPPPNLLRVA